MDTTRAARLDKSTPAPLSPKQMASVPTEGDAPSTLGTTLNDAVSFARRAESPYSQGASEKCESGCGPGIQLSPIISSTQ